MRAFYCDRWGNHADLCQYLNRTTTRLTVRTAAGITWHRAEYPTWDAAIDALKMCGHDGAWISETSGQTLT